ncbi:LysR family transcriptional regulator [Streptomyces albidoflavus]|nr:LysR family transcriptional regulator [Streptomyces albidoflavus]
MPERLGLEAFLVLAEELHFRRTAERLHVTTGRISQVLKKPEARVGAPLFARDGRIVTLTGIGGQPREDRQSDLGEGRCVTGLSGGEDEREGPAAGIGGEVDLRGQSAAGTADGVVTGFAGRRTFLQAPAAC